jgi:hypothetical protein
MKRSVGLLLSLLAVSTTLAADDNAFNASFWQEKMSEARSSQGRSLEDILKQHGKPLEPGKQIILTADGIITDPTPDAKKVVNLYHRLLELNLARNPLLTRQAVANQQLANPFFMLDFIQTQYGTTPSPLFAFATQMVKEQEEVNKIRTEAFSLASSPTHQKDVELITAQLAEYQSTLSQLEELLNSIWLAFIDSITDVSVDLGE